MGKEIVICEQCMALELLECDCEGAVCFLANLLEQQGYVEKEYVEKVLERETVCPTGLQFADIAIAMPHGDSAPVHQAAIAVGRCPNGITFRSMEDPDEEITVQLVVLLAVKDPDNHIMVLNNLMQMFTKTEICEKIMSFKSNRELCSFFVKHMQP